MRKRSDRSQPMPYRPFTEDHHVARAILTGDRWFYAWLSAKGTSYPVISRKTKIPAERLTQLDRDAHPTPAEAAALCALWEITTDDLEASIRFGR